MTVEIRTKAVTQQRNTFSHVARRIGGDKPASRYQEATYDVQPAVNFHYRPLWEPDKDIYDTRRTRIVVKDWYAFKDPRQFYYGTYTITRARQQETIERNIEFVERRALLRDLPEELRERLIFALVPLRHLEWGANSNNCYVTAYGWGTAITQATMFHTMDRLALAQHLSRIGLLLDGNTSESLKRGKSLWMEHEAWQGVRRLIEKLMVTKDWFELFVAQNLILDGLLHPLVYREFQQRIEGEVGPALNLTTEFMTTWFDETSRWVDSIVTIAAAESPANADLLRGWVASWEGRIREALMPYARALLGKDADAAWGAVESTYEARIVKLRLRTPETAQ